MLKTPADIIIEKFGGPHVIATAIGVDVSRVYRWTYPRERGGTDGRIPGPQQGAIMKAARVLGITISTADFFTSEEIGR